jgi:hypothetical protein
MCGILSAFDGAWQSIVASGAKLSGQQSELTRELLAKYIIEQARQGELDQCRLRGGALLKSETCAVRPQVIPHPVCATNYRQEPAWRRLGAVIRAFAAIWRWADPPLA